MDTLKRLLRLAGAVLTAFPGYDVPCPFPTGILSWLTEFGALTCGKLDHLILPILLLQGGIKKSLVEALEV